LAVGIGGGNADTFISPEGESEIAGKAVSVAILGCAGKIADEADDAAQIVAYNASIASSAVHVVCKTILIRGHTDSRS
jgi:hypothetical protein